MLAQQAAAAQLGAGEPAAARSTPQLLAHVNSQIYALLHRLELLRQLQQCAALQGTIRDICSVWDARWCRELKSRAVPLTLSAVARCCRASSKPLRRSSLPSPVRRCCRLRMSCTCCRGAASRGPRRCERPRTRWCVCGRGMPRLAISSPPQGTDCAFRYEEDEESAATFFLPYVWQCVQPMTVDFAWDVAGVSLVEVDGGGKS